MHRRSRRDTHLPKDISILYEDSDILVAVKPAGLLTMGTDRDKSRTLYALLTDYVRKGYSRSSKRVFIVHRLDRDTSGVLVFAKNMEAKLRLQDQWEKTEKKYIAVVHGRFKQREDTITTYLAENKAQLVYSTADAAKGKLARTASCVVGRRGAGISEAAGRHPVRSAGRRGFSANGRYMNCFQIKNKSEPQQPKISLHRSSRSFYQASSVQSEIFST